MSQPSLADFLETLHQSHELLRVEAETNSAFEIAWITDQAAREHKAALLFGRVTGHGCPVATNLLGSPSRVCRALGVKSLDELAGRVEETLGNASHGGMASRLGIGVDLGGQTAPRRVKSGRCQQVVCLDRDVDLARLPAVLAWPRETHPAITAGQMVLVDAGSGQRWVGRGDVDVLGPNRLAVRWAPHETPARLLEDYRRRNAPMPVAIVLGGDPALLAASMAPLPDGVDRWGVAGWLRGGPVELVPARRVKLDVPADAEIVLEGTIDPAAPLAEVGPRATPLGFYLPAAMAPVIGVEAITHRANPVWPAMIHGPAPCEWTVLARAMLRVFLPVVRWAIPDLVDMNLPEFGGGRQVAFASIRKTHAGQAQRVAQALWGLPTMTFAKWLVLVDEDVDVHDERQVGAAIVAHADPAGSLLLAEGPPDVWDPAGEPVALGQKLLVDATAKRFGQRPTAAQPLQMNEPIRQSVAARWDTLFPSRDK